MYDKDYEYAHSRLVNTIVRNGKHPVLVKAVRGDGSVITETIITERRRECALEDLDLSSPPLGYINTPRGVQYIARKPMRRDWRQGLRSNNMVVLGGRRSEVTPRMIYAAIRGVYPTLAEAMERSMIDGISVAFSREWAVLFDYDEKAMYLRYKWHGVAGVIDTDSQEVRLRDGDAYLFTNLAESLQDAIA